MRDPVGASPSAAGAGHAPESRALPHASVIAFGNLLQGDCSLGLHVIEALKQESLPPETELHYMDDAYHHLPSLFQDRSAVIIFHYMFAATPPDKDCISSLDMQQFLSLACSGGSESVALKPLAKMLIAPTLAGTVPAQIRFVLAGVALNQTEASLSWNGRKTARKVVHRILSQLRDWRCCEGTSVARLYAMPWLKTTL